MKPTMSSTRLQPRRPQQPRLDGDRIWNEWAEEHTLLPTYDVWEADYKTHSTILGPDGEPIPYQSKKLGHIGFTPLKERP